MIEMCKVSSGDVRCSEIINELQKLMEKHGDLYIYSVVDCDFIGNPRFDPAETLRPKSYPSDNVKPAMFVFE